MNNYLEQLNNQKEENHEYFESMREYAVSHKVPIIQRDSLILLQSLIELKKVKRILEIGTAIAYSALGFCNNHDDVIVDTIERDPVMYEEAKKNVQALHKENQVNLFFGDALEIDMNNFQTYDMIFIDAAKAQYQKFFDRYSPLLNKGGFIATDNILFHGCVESDENLSRNLRSLVRKIDNYNGYLKDLKGYTTYYLDSGDGLAITMVKE